MSEILDSQELYESNPQAFERAGQGKRLANYLIDLAGYYVLSGMIGGLYGLYMIQTQGDAYLFAQQENAGSVILEYLQGAIIILSYYTVSEYYFKGKTLGKLITRTRAVTEDNQRLDFKSAFLRSLCRIIPFEPLSFLMNDNIGWHDSIPKTRVIEDKGWREM